MKKAKALTAALAAGLLSIGAGYAAWTDNLQITNTVKTGELAGTFTAATLATDSYVNKDADVSLASTGRTKVISYQVSNLYPGAGYTLNATFKNDGTIPAKVAGITVTGPLASDNAPTGYTKFTDLSKLVIESGTLVVDKVTGTDTAIDLTGKKVSELQSLLKTNVVDKNTVLEPVTGTTAAETIKLNDVHIILDNNETGTEKSWTKFTLSIDLGQK